MPDGKKRALRVEYIKQDRKRNNFCLLSPTLPPLLLQPLNASSLESTAALDASWSTPNLWPLTPSTSEFITEPSAQSAQRGAHPAKNSDDDREERQSVQVWTVSAGVTDVLRHCLGPSPRYSQHIVSIRPTKSPSVSVTLWMWVCVCLHVMVPSVLMLLG